MSHILYQHIAKDNSPGKIFSYSPSDSSPLPQQTVSYRSKEHMELMHGIINSEFKHKSSGKRKALHAFVKFVIGIHQNLDKGSCIARHEKIGQNLIMSGYHRNLSKKQIGRLSKRSEELGLLTRVRTKQLNNFHDGAYRFEPTRLGLDIYYYHLERNKSHFLIRCEEEHVPVVDNVVIKAIHDLNKKKMSSLETPVIIGDSGLEKKNVLANIDLRNIRNIDIHTRWSTGDKSPKKVSSFIKIPLERKQMSNTPPEKPPSPTQPLVLPGSKPGKIDYNAKPIDLDNPPRDILLSSPHIQTREADGFVSTLTYGKVRTSSPPETSTWKPGEVSEPPSEPREPQLSSQVCFMVSQSGLLNSEKITLANYLKSFESEDGVKLKIIESLVEMVENKKKSGKQITNFPLMVRTLVSEQIKRQSPRYLSTFSVDN